MNSTSYNIRTPHEIYSDSLEEINGVRFTPREIDIIACVLNGRSAKTIPSLLAISSKTVATHLANIRAKTGCPSRESIISFVEKSGKLSLIKHDYYSSLLTQAFFENQIKGISKENKVVTIVLGPELGSLKLYTDKLKNHLELAGFQTNMVVDPDHNGINVYLVEDERNKAIDGAFQCNYYAWFFPVLKEMLPQQNIDQLINDFKAYSEGIESPRATESSTVQPLEKKGLSKNVRIGLGLFCCVLISVTLFWSKPSTQVSSARSDLILPSELTLVDRSGLISEINHAFNQQNGISSVAIVGIGGAGKTTLARNYGKRLHDNAVWEINAETPESLQRSFEDLAFALAKNEDDRKALCEIQETKIAHKKQEMIIAFVRERLRLYPDWLLIYDNVETYKDVEKYYPHDMALWGQGRVLITTRNATILNNSAVGSMIQIGELSDGQKLELFSQIMRQGSSAEFKENKAKELLVEIPSFPLDVSLAAYYIKSTNIPYEKYLERINEDDDSFKEIQQGILGESGGYTHTRYKIVSLSMKKVIEEEQNTVGLFFLIGLLDSQDIPTDILEKYKDGPLSDKFLYSLKKYSLITDGSSSPTSGPTVCIHRSTQKVILDYLTNTLSDEVQHKLVGEIGKSLLSYLNEAVYVNEDLHIMQSLISHLGKFISQAKNIDSDIHNMVTAEVGHLKFMVGYHQTAKEILEHNLAIVENTGRHSEALTLRYLGEIYREHRDIGKALPMLERSLQLYQDSFPEDYVGNAEAHCTLATAYRTLGYLDKAISYMEKGLNISAAHYSKYDARRAKHLGHLAYYWCLAGDYERAKQPLEQSLEIYNTSGVNNHWNMTRTYAYLGELYRGLGNHDKALSYFKRSLDILESHSNKELYFKTFIAFRLYRSAILYKQQGDYNKAKALLIQAYEVYGKSWGFDNSETVQVLLDLAEVLLEEGQDLQAAEQHVTNAMKVFRANNFTNIYKALECLARLCIKKAALSQKNGDLGQSEALKAAALSYMKQSLEVARAHLPSDSPHLARLQSAVKNLQQ